MCQRGVIKCSLQDSYISIVADARVVASAVVAAVLCMEVVGEGGNPTAKGRLI